LRKFQGESGMPVNNNWFEYHLTPMGWISGSEGNNYLEIKEKIIPKDRVLILRFYEILSSPFSKLDKWYTEHWRHEDTAKINVNIEIYGEMPEGIQN
jgi:hypothetical protein